MPLAMHGRGCAWQRGHAWQRRVCMMGACMVGETATAVHSTHPIGMHSCSLLHSLLRGVNVP